MSLSLISERERREKKCRGGVRDGTEQRGTEREREPQSNFFLKGCQAVSSQRKEGTRAERKNVEVSNLFISPKKMTVVYQLTIHSSFCTSPRLPSLCLLFCLSHCFPPPPSVLSNAALPIYCNSPSSFLFFLIFLFHLAAFPLPIKLSQTSLPFPPFLSFKTCSHVSSNNCRSILS